MRKTVSKIYGSPEAGSTRFAVEATYEHGGRVTFFLQDGKILPGNQFELEDIRRALADLHALLSKEEDA